MRHDPIPTEPCDYPDSHPGFACAHQVSGSNLRAHLADGLPLVPGQLVKDFRGETVTYVRATRPTGNGKDGKVEIRYADGYLTECYAGVIDATVTVGPDRPVTTVQEAWGYVTDLADQRAQDAHDEAHAARPADEAALYAQQRANGHRR